MFDENQEANRPKKIRRLPKDNNDNNDKEKKSKEKKPVVQPWTDIFQPSKIVVSMNPRNFESPELVIRFAQSEFLTTVGYEEEDILGMPFEIILGQASIRLNTYKIQTAILMGKTASEYNNLYRRDGVMLSCHLTVQSLTGTSETNSSARREKWAVITIKSASIVGKSQMYPHL